MKRHFSARSFLLPVLFFLVVGHDLRAWTPGTGSPSAAAGFAVDTTNRRDVLSFYNCVYTASVGYEARLGWTGNTGSGIAGTTSAAFKEDVRRRINFYRALSSLPADIVFNATKSAKDQDAALMMSRNNALSHTPPVNWLSYTAGGAEAAGKSNIALGFYGPGAIDAYMDDPGAGNEVAGHRRWFTYSRAAEMGTGDLPVSGTYNSANAVWVSDNFKPAPAPQFVAWPNAGYSPINLLTNRWSISYPGANFAAATVTMSKAGVNVPLTVISRTDNGYGDNTMVWEPTGLPTTIASDTAYLVSVAGISGTGVPTNASYSVTLFDPTVLGETVTIAGSATPPTTGANYTFNSVAQADSYDLSVAQLSSAAWLEGAEDSPVPQIGPTITGNYALRQTTTKRTGSKAFHLAFPDFVDQSFEITRSIIPSATSVLRFYDLARFATTTTTLSAELLTSLGTWITLWSRNGVADSSSSQWDASFSSRSVSLAAYAGQIVKIRFVLRSNGGAIFNTPTDNYGFFLDDISVTNASQLSAETITPLTANATGFTLNGTTVGSPLAAGTTYYLRVAPRVGLKNFGFGPFKTVVPQVLTGYNAWVQGQYPTVLGGITDDPEKDGLPNGLEYAYGLNPLVANTSETLPRPNLVGNNYVVNFSQPAGVSGVVYAMQYSTDLGNWINVPDTGSGSAHIFSVNTTGKTSLFFRHIPNITP